MVGSKINAFLHKITEFTETPLKLETTKNSVLTSDSLFSLTFPGSSDSFGPGCSTLYQFSHREKHHQCETLPCHRGNSRKHIDRQHDASDCGDNPGDFCGHRCYCRRLLDMV